MAEYTDKYDNLVKLVSGEYELDGKTYSLKEEFEKFFIRGNKVAGTRVRKFMQELKKASQEIRNDVQEFKEKV